jgi:SAM-dependent methyltransferase
MNTDSVTATVSERLTELFDHLGIERAHVGSAPIGDLVALLSARPDSVASVALVNPTRLTAEAVRSFADRLIMFTGDQGPAADSIAAAMRSLEGVKLHVAENYNTAIWADYAADHADRILAPWLDFLARREAKRPATALSTTQGGVVAGISYSVKGKGPALVLFPASLAPSQWAPIADRLAENFAVITLGGPHLGYLAVLEDRGQDPSYRRVLRSLLTEVNAGPTDTLLEVGCGSGVNLRWLATENFCAKPLTGMDLNAYFLREAESIAELNGVANLIKWQHGDAEAIPFDDSSFDVILTYTMLEECDANKALAELFRVLKPGGRVAVVVRAVDIPVFWHLPVDSALISKVNVPNVLVSAHGCGDASLSERLRNVGYMNIQYWPGFYGTANPQSPHWMLYRSIVAPQNLSPEDLPKWQTAHEEAARTGTGYFAQPIHCAVGTKP